MYLKSLSPGLSGVSKTDTMFSLICQFSFPPSIHLASQQWNLSLIPVFRSHLTSDPQQFLVLFEKHALESTHFPVLTALRTRRKRQKRMQRLMYWPLFCRNFLWGLEIKIRGLTSGSSVPRFTQRPQLKKSTILSISPSSISSLHSPLFPLSYLLIFPVILNLCCFYVIF